MPFIEAQPDYSGAFLEMRVQRYYFFRNYQNFWGEFFKNTQILCFYSLESNKNHYLCRRYSHNHYLMEQTKQLVESITKGIQEKKGTRIVVADLSGIDGTICRYFVICQGNSPSQVEAITESVGDFARKELDERPAHVVGLDNAQWVAMDYTDVLVHIFLPDVRDYYDLEHLWDDAKLTYIPDLD